MAARARISQTLRRALFYAFFGLVLPLGFVVMVLFGSIRKNVQRQLMAGLETASHSLTDRVQAHLEQKLVRARDFGSDGLLLQTLTEFRDGKATDASLAIAGEHYRANKLPLESDCLAIFAFGSDGRLAFGTSTESTSNLLSAAELGVHGRAAGFGPPGLFAGVSTYTVVAPVAPGTNGQPLGFLLFHYKLAELNKVLTGTAEDARNLTHLFNNQAETQRTSLVDREGTILVGTAAQVGRKANPELLAQAKQNPGGYFGEYTNANGKAEFGYTSPLPQTPWTLVASLPRVEALGTLDRWRAGAFVFILWAGMLVMLIASLGALRAMRPIQEVADAAEAIAEGRSDKRLAVNARNPEGVRVAESFNRMVDKLQATTSELRTNEARYRTLVEQQLSGIYVIQGDRFVYVNPRMAEIMGYTPDEMTSRPVLDFIGPDSRVLATENIRRRLSGEVQSVRYQLHMLQKSGSLVDAEVHGSRIEYGGHPAILGTLLDVTERNRAERELRQSENRFRELAELGNYLNHARTYRQAARIIVDTADHLMHWHECQVDLYQPASQTIVNLIQLRVVDGQRQEIPADPNPIPPPAFLRPVLGGDSVLIAKPEAATFAGDGQATSPARPASAMVVPIREAQDVIGILSLRAAPEDTYTNADLETLQALADYCAGAFERIGAEESVRHLNQELEQRVQQRTAELQAVNQELESFSYSVSHDLRAPLRGIAGFSQALTEQYSGRLDEAGRGYLSRVRAAADRMGQLIDDLLNLSRVTRLDMRREPVDLSATALAVVAELQQAYPGRNITFSAEPGITVTGDPRLLRVVLDNLIGNAWKFTSKLPEGRIQFGKLPANGGQCVCYVRDNGAGFDMKYAAKLFGAFQRLHAMTEYPGTGIGLATVQRIVNRHGGRIWAEGAVNEGATFFFEV